VPSDRRLDSKALPSAMPAWGRPAGGSMSRRFDGKEDKINAPPADLTTPADDEAARIKAMFQANAEHWEETQERMSHAIPIYTSRGGGPKRPFQPTQHQPTFESKPLPPGYICHRCSKKGHWIQDCPTNDDREFDNRPRIKRTTGIPRSFLKAVDISADSAPQGIMVTPEGGFVVAQPDSAAWQRQRARPSGLTGAEVREKPPSDTSLSCPICTRLFRDAMKTPCCSKTFCEECIQTHLLERDFICPGCQSKISSLGNLLPDLASRERAQQYVASEIAKSNQDSDQNTPESSQETTNTIGETPEFHENPYEDPEFTFDAQPGGNPIPTTSFNPAESEITQIQAQLAQLIIMLQTPQLAPPMRMQLQLQFQDLTMRLNQLQMSALYSSGPTNTYMNQNPTMMSGMGGTVYGINASTNGNVGSGYVNYQNPGLMNDAESPYQRLPVNNRRRVQKRDRPEDFLDLNSGQKIARYYE